MSAFNRSISGLSNMYLFYRVDLMVYVEGSSSLSLADVERGAGDDSTDDAAFWAKVFGLRTAAIVVAVRSIGSKTNVQAIAHLIASGNITRVVAGMDRDFDDRRGALIAHANVLYSHGYSWENDVFQGEVIEQVLRDLMPNRSVNLHLAGEIARAKETLEKSFSVLVRLDHALAACGAHLTDRDAVKNSINVRTPASPTIDRVALANVLWHKRQVRCGPKDSAHVGRDLYGHAVARWWREQLSHLLARTQGLKIPKVVVNRLAISTYFRGQHRAIDHHYRLRVDAVTI